MCPLGIGNTENLNSIDTSGPCFNMNTAFPGIGILITKMIRSSDRIIFILGIPIRFRGRLYIGTGSRLYLMMNVCYHGRSWVTFEVAHVLL